MYGSIVTLTALAASFSAAMAGSATVKNNCDYDVYLWSVASSADSTMETITSGDDYSEDYQTNSDGGGISIKIATTESQSEVTQFEYTISGSDVYYDISNINGYPFLDGGLELIPSDSTCTQVVCDAGVEDCTSAYNQPDDNWATAACSTDADLVLTLCPSSTEEATASGTAVTTVTSALPSATAASKRRAIPPQARHLHQKHHAQAQ